jgi:hypothetical protein
MKNTFKSRDFGFRPTTLSAAMLAAGLIEQPHLVREAKREGLLRARHDRFNREPSVAIPNINADVRPASKVWKSNNRKAA